MVVFNSDLRIFSSFIFSRHSHSLSEKTLEIVHCFIISCKIIFLKRKLIDSESGVRSIFNFTSSSVEKYCGIMNVEN